MQIKEKEDQICRYLKQYDRVALAFSGGADSSLLLWYAVKVLGPDNVVAFTSRSCLLKQSELDRISRWFTRHNLPGQVIHRFIDIYPLDWQDFAANPADRCYLCKKRVYSLFLEQAERLQVNVLLDGTNADDLQSDRPGLKALKELGIKTPLAKAGLTKKVVRALSREAGLETWDKPSSSCLATRIPTGLDITIERIDLVRRAESVLEEMGFAGCRVRLDTVSANTAYIQVQEKDIHNITIDLHRAFLLEKFRKIGFSRVFLDIYGR